MTMTIIYTKLLLYSIFLKQKLDLNKSNKLYFKQILYNWFTG